MRELQSNSKGFLSTERLSRGPWQAFERGIARLLVHSGWEISEIVGGSGDHGADIIGAVRGADGALNEFVYQAKFSETNKPLSVDIIGDVKRAMEYYGIDNGIAASNRSLGESQNLRLKQLQANGYNIQTFLSKSVFDSYVRLADWPIEKRALKKYQYEALSELQEAYMRGDKRGLICLATGLGKTFVAATFLRWLFECNPDLNVLILANTKALVEQFDRAIWSNIPKWVSTHLLYDSEKPAFLEGVTLSTFQSFMDFHKRNEDFRYDIVIVDEAHHAPADTYSEIVKKLDPRFLLGLTATPFRKDDRDVTYLFGKPLVYYSVYKALQKGFLAKVEYHLHNDNIDEDWITQNSRKGHTLKQLNKKIFLPERDDVICETIYDVWTKNSLEKGIVFCNSSEHAERIEKLLSVNFQLPVRSLTTRVKDSRERTKRLREFRNGTCKIITCYDMLNEGVDVPDVDFIVFLRVTHSRVYFLQQLGRGLRYKEGKTLIVHDFVADIRRVKRVQSFQNEFAATRKNEIENLYFESDFELNFKLEQTNNFLDLVTRDISEEAEDDEEFFLSV
ncbi:DEAD/DEAH box helicase family protein [Flavobacterium caeni]|uniref:Restriction endonuclease n=1 Tax=Flavobacterium caeni TaxID=490189 RepID=A0A1G5FE54_9FLAO|nr:DEAD/DEAH box helicase family protein [Flavobacterium caeni]SCY37160.1 Restriction endonuclease [Flavobacterium caeni]